MIKDIYKNATKTMIFNLQIQHIIAGLAKWIITDPIHQSIAIDWFQGYSRKMNRLTQHHGIKHVVAVVKLHQLCLTRYLAGDPLFTNTLRVGINSEGLPKDLRAVIHGVRSRDLPTLRFLLTVFSAVRLIPGDGTLPHSSIVLESRGDPALEEEIVEWCKSSPWFLSIRGYFEQGATKHLEWSLPHLSTKMGPNGQALGTALRDLMLLPRWLRDAIKLVGGRELGTYMSTLKDSFETVPHWVTDKISNKDFLRRLSVIRDRACKNRPIAILDYWSQTCLIGVHKTLFSVLKALPCDCTFDQGRITSLMTKFQSFQCMDLTSATDRFPVSLQESILGLLKDPSFAKSWRDIMVKLPFFYEGKEYTYNAGQPMGAYSSWAMFALSHHVVVQYAASLVGFKQPYKNYALLGDDIVIGDQEVGDIYQSIINRLGVDISDSKSHKGNSLCEFAKRTFYDLKEITGVPLPGLLEAKGNPFLLSQELAKAIERGTLDISSVPVSTSLKAFFSEWMSQRSSDRMTILIQDWWSATNLDNWVNSDNCQGSPPGVSCNHQPESSRAFFKYEVILPHIEEVLKTLRVKLSQSIRVAMSDNEKLSQEILEYHETGPDRDSLPNLHGIYFQPWFLVMENQVNLVDHYFELVKEDRLKRSESLDIEQYHTWLSQVRICDPREIRSIRHADMVLSNKRKQFSELLPYVKSL